MVTIDEDEVGETVGAGISLIELVEDIDTVDNDDDEPCRGWMKYTFRPSFP